jgi:hypothetical protein
MIHALHKTLERLIRMRLRPEDGEVTFETPTAEWLKLTKNRVNFHLYDVRERLELRGGEPEPRRTGDWSPGTVPVPGVGGGWRFERPPVLVSLSYMTSLWGQSFEDQHRLLWVTLGVLLRFSPIPRTEWHEELKPLIDWERLPTAVAQPTELIRGPAEFWGAMSLPIRPSVHLAATLPLDPNTATADPPDVRPAGPVRAVRVKVSEQPGGASVVYDGVLPNPKPADRGAP